MAYYLRHASLAYRPSQPKHCFPILVFKPAIAKGTQGLVNPRERLHAQQGYRVSSVSSPASLAGRHQRSRVHRHKLGGLLLRRVRRRHCFKALTAHRAQLLSTGRPGKELKGKLAWGHWSTRCKKASWTTTFPLNSFMLNEEDLIKQRWKTRGAQSTHQCFPEHVELLG